MADTLFEPKPKMLDEKPKPDYIALTGAWLKKMDYTCKKCDEQVIYDYYISCYPELRKESLCPACAGHWDDYLCPCGNESSETPLPAPHHRLCDQCKADKEYDDSQALQYLIEMYGSLITFKTYKKEEEEDSEYEEYLDNDGPWDDF